MSNEKVRLNWRFGIVYRCMEGGVKEMILGSVKMAYMILKWHIDLTCPWIQA
jgi:hypothetical protein